MPPATASARTPSPVVAVHSGKHTFGGPEQFVVPDASKAYSLWSSEPTYTTPLTTTGEENTTSPVRAVHNGTHVLVAPPEQPVFPAASNAYSLSSAEPMYTTPLTTAGDDRSMLSEPPLVAAHNGAHLFGLP